MTQVISKEQEILDQVQTLTLQQQQQVLDFIEFLHYQTQKPKQELEMEEQERLAFQEKLKKYAGCVDGGPGDLATNKVYFKSL